MPKKLFSSPQLRSEEQERGIKKGGNQMGGERRLSFKARAFIFLWFGLSFEGKICVEGNKNLHFYNILSRKNKRLILCLPFSSS